MVGQTRKATSVQESHVLDKTKMCKFFAKGQCTRGRFCTFAHRTEQLHAQPDLFRTQLCYAFSRNGSCRAGDACKFAHSSNDVRPVSTLDAVCADRPSRKSRLGARQAGAAEPVDAARPHPRWAGLRPRQSQAEALNSGEAVCSRRAPVKCPWEEVGCGLSLLSTEEGDFSRQTTPGWQSMHDSGSVASCRRGSWDEEGASVSRSEESTSEGISEEGLRLGAEAGLTLFLRNTFIDADPAEAESPAPQRRAKSVPARRACGPGARA